mmetsp:Transcript_35362/g.75376  ORF Transcript_35362/g.75376 Transcript_35362/m.75376 type:complete len:424 (+) Transcript_35362:99-1370(+)
MPLPLRSCATAGPASGKSNEQPPRGANGKPTPGSGHPHSLLKKTGLQIAVPVLCSAILGLVAFLAMAAFNLFAESSGELDHEGENSRRMPIYPGNFVGHFGNFGGFGPAGLGGMLGGGFSQGLPPGLPDGGDARSQSQLHGLISNLEQQLHRQEQSRLASNAMAEAKMEKMETLLQTEIAAVTRKFGGSSAQGSVAGSAALVTATSNLDAGLATPTAGVAGVDWAAWSAGADIDHSATSWGLGRDASPSGLLHRATRVMATVLPQYRAHIGPVSHPPSVVLAADAAPPSRCFRFEGSGSIAIRLLHPRKLTHLVLERLLDWADLEPEASPRFFSAAAELADVGRGDLTTGDDVAEDAYRHSLGDFEYALHGGRAQAFALPPSTSGTRLIRGVKLTFHRNWGGSFTSLCRVRLLGPHAAAAAEP